MQMINISHFDYLRFLELPIEKNDEERMKTMAPF